MAMTGLRRLAILVYWASRPDSTPAAMPSRRERADSSFSSTSFSWTSRAFSSASMRAPLSADSDSVSARSRAGPLDGLHRLQDRRLAVGDGLLGLVDLAQEHRVGVVGLDLELLALEPLHDGLLVRQIRLGLALPALGAREAPLRPRLTLASQSARSWDRVARRSGIAPCSPWSCASSESRP